MIISHLFAIAILSFLLAVISVLKQQKKEEIIKTKKELQKKRVIFYKDN